jgi:hypothetical protein
VKGKRKKDQVGRQPPLLPARSIGKAASSADVDDVAVEVQEEVQEATEDVDEGG